MAKLESFIILTQLIILSSSMIINVCDCNNPRHVGILDTETSAYCRKEKTEDPILADYRFFVNEEPHMSWEGFICKAWTKIKTIDGFFIGGFDTVFSSEIQHLSENDCWRMQQTKLCGENNMIEDGGHLSYTSIPNGEGMWMQKKT